MATLSVVDQKSTLLCTSLGQSRGLNLADRPNMAAALRGEGFVLGVPVM